MRKITNKEKSLTLTERVSAPGALKKKGSVTIEAAFGIPIFLFAVLCLIWMIEMQSIRICILSAAQNAAKSAAEDTAVLPVLNTISLKSDIISLIGEERINRSIIEGGSAGISCLTSYVSPGTGEMNINVQYKVTLPLPMFGRPSAKMKESFKISAWTGYRDDAGDDRDGQTVYITDYASVYHEDYQCTYLQLSVRFIPAEALGGIRNESGGIYHACEKCVFGPAMAGVYITGQGGRYHHSLTCSGLKRTIRTVDRSEVKGLGGCSRCSN